MAYNILIVDDSILIREMVAKTLSIANIDIGDIYKAANGKEALDVLTSKWVDIMFADLNMPEMNGFELLDKMSEDGMLKTVPSVIISSQRKIERKDELIKMGVKAFVAKPFTPEQLTAVVTHILGSREGQNNE